MQHKHTQGEWFTENYGHCLAVEVKLPNGQHHTLFTDQFCYGSRFDGNAEANARLIAAAPDLLEALVNVLNWHKAHEQISFLEEEAIKKAEAAIQKATNPTK